MKNLFLTVILLLTVSVTFATNDVESVSTLDSKEIPKLKNVESINNNFLELFKLCNITHRVTDEEGDVIDTVHYSVTVEKGESCAELSKKLRDLSVLLVYWGMIF